MITIEAYIVSEEHLLILRNVNLWAEVSGAQMLKHQQVRAEAHVPLDVLTKVPISWLPVLAVFGLCPALFSQAVLMTSPPAHARASHSRSNTSPHTHTREALRSRDWRLQVFSFTLKSSDAKGLSLTGKRPAGSGDSPAGNPTSEQGCSCTGPPCLPPSGRCERHTLQPAPPSPGKGL